MAMLPYRLVKNPSGKMVLPKRSTDLKIVFVKSEDVQRWTPMVCVSKDCHQRPDGTSKQWRGPAAKALHFGEPDVSLCCPKCGRMVETLTSAS